MLYLDLDSFGNDAAPGGATPDGDLLRRVNRRVAGYYLAVPLAGEDDRVTVATAYPDNTAALWMLRRLLRADVVAVAAGEDALQAAIARIYPAPAPAAGPILAWTSDPAWVGSVAAAAGAFSVRAASPVVLLDPAQSLDQALERAAHDCSLLVVRPGDEVSPADLAVRSPVSLLLLRDEFAPVEQILVALRGFASDYEVLDYTRPFLAGSKATATVLPLTRPETHPDARPLDDGAARRHLRAFLRHSGHDDARIAIRLCSGDPVSQIAGEMARGRYSMLVIAAEGEGQFVRRALSRLEQDAAGGARRPSTLIVKPPVGDFAAWPGPPAPAREAQEKTV